MKKNKWRFVKENEMSKKDIHTWLIATFEYGTKINPISIDGYTVQEYKSIFDYILKMDLKIDFFIEPRNNPVVLEFEKGVISVIYDGGWEKWEENNNKKRLFSSNPDIFWEMVEGDEIGMGLWPAE